MRLCYPNSELDRPAPITTGAFGRWPRTYGRIRHTGGVEWDTELFRTIQSVINGAMEDAVVVPGMTIGGTDNRFLRERGIPAYGFMPCLLSREERAGFHGNNEFMTIDNLNMGNELMYEIVRRMCE